MSRRFPCSVPGCPVCRLPAIDRWIEDWDRAARKFDPGFERRRQKRTDEAARRAKEQLRRLVEDAERARREDDPTVN